MKLEIMRRDAEKTLAFFEKKAGEGIPGCGIGPVLSAKRTLELAGIIEVMSDDEWKRVHDVPIYMNDMRVCKDIKEKYGLSWNELRGLRSVER